MAARVTEIRTQGFRGGVPTRRWIFRDFDDILAVDTQIQAFATNQIGLTWGGLPADILNRSIEEIGYREYYVEIPYNAKAGSIIMPGAGTASSPATQHGGDSGADEPVLYDISFSVRGGTQHITQSKETLQSAATNHPDTDAARTARNFSQAIGVDPKTGEVAGVDILVPEVTWTRNVLIPVRAFTGAYAKRCELAVGKVNSAPFFGYNARECLCTSITVGTVDGSGYRPGQFEFAVKRNRTLTLTISADPELELDDVDGWSYVWATYEPRKKTVDGKEKDVVTPFEAYEERVYDEYDFGLLNLEESRAA